MDTPQRLEALARTKASALRHEVTGDGGTELGARYVVNPDEVQSLVDAWPQAPRTTAERLLTRYGPPNEVTPTKLMWYRNGPWRRTVLTADEIVHHFPTTHTDFLSQYVDYRVPPDACVDLLRFDGSVLIDRTAGELGARCDSEAMNILTLNLAHDIVTGERDVAGAREHYAETAAAYHLGRPAPDAERLRFAVEGPTADPDENVMAAALAHRAAEKMKGE
ncbi:hypothetical protein SAMN05421810_11536 [Amycolatopsis arida]|uniref:Uncharacterized protein n=1 Tax=Amycolatopsis arida TaxID=587909 RepID=A0A1I6AWH0_9PSEU|nr:hypothetical protein [Amycolatopsis arida]TDX85382.1 hypothetical protein CLV69_11541 [Amycolatopsis arida]SFQ73061.1 hypothetical protein SAMN05421810_11536 [Amycolatopsis arida]